MNNQMNAQVKLSISMVIFGTLGLFTRNIAVSSGELALYRAILAASLLSIYLIVTKQKIDFKRIRKEIPLLLASGIAMGTNWTLLFQAYRYTTISVATLTNYFAPVIVTAVCPFLFREQLTKRQIICFVMSTLGLIMITGFGTVGESGTDFLGILFGLASAVFYAAVILLNKFIKNVTDLHRTLLQFIAAIIVLAPYVASTSGITLRSLSGIGWTCLLIVGLVHTGITYCVYFSALKVLPGQSSSVLSYIEPLVAVLVSVILLKENMTFQQAIGGILILGFTLLNEISPKGKNTMV